MVHWPERENTLFFIIGAFEKSCTLVVVRLAARARGEAGAGAPLLLGRPANAKGERKRPGRLTVSVRQSERVGPENQSVKTTKTK